jgi:hypothetical protein
MYATCLFCNKPLGQNAAIERFPVGRRLAFDAIKGRLWVVCSSCERWNLSPLEERWEAIEDSERLYRSTRLRAATDQIGLARLRDGTELIRIGEPLRPEFAAWRYGDQFGRRRRRNLLIAGAGVGAVGALVAGGMAAGLSIGGFGWLIFKRDSLCRQRQSAEHGGSHQDKRQPDPQGSPRSPLGDDRRSWRRLADLDRRQTREGALALRGRRRGPRACAARGGAHRHASRHLLFCAHDPRLAALATSGPGGFGASHSDVRAGYLSAVAQRA